MIRAFKSKRYVVHRDLAWRQRHDLQTYCVAASRLSTLTYYRSSLRGPVQAYAPTLAAGFAPGALFPPGPASTAFCPTQKGRAQERARERRCRRWNGFLGIVQPAYAINRTQGSNVLADVPAFTRKVLLHALAKALNAAAKLKMRPSMTVRSYVSGIVLSSKQHHWWDGQTPFTLRIAHLALVDIMQSDIPLITRATKRMRESTRNVVAFQNQDTLPAMHGEQCRSR